MDTTPSRGGTGDGARGAPNWRAWLVTCALVWGTVLALVAWGWTHPLAVAPAAPAGMLCVNEAGRNVLGTPWPVCRQTPLSTPVRR